MCPYLPCTPLVCLMAYLYADGDESYTTTIVSANVNLVYPPRKYRLVASSLAMAQPLPVASARP